MLGESRPAKFSFFFPIVGVALIFNNFAIEVASQISENFSPSAENSIKNLYFLYFGLLFFSAASLVFLFFCPRVVKEYTSAKHFIESTKSTYSSGDLRSYAEYIVSTSREIELKGKCKGIIPVLDSRGIEAVNLDLQTEIKKAYYRISALENYFARYTCALFYAVGFLLLFIPTASGILAVIYTMWPS